MKKIFGIFALVMMLGATFSACSSDGPDKPEDKVRLYNEADSVAFCKVMKAAYGPYLDGLLYSMGASLDKASSWPGAVWGNVSGSSEKRIVGISLANLFEETGHMPSVAWPSEDYGHVSPAIWECEYLQTLVVKSEVFHGEIPTCGDSGGNLKHFEMRNTNISSIPLDIFKLPALEALYIYGNMALKELPDGIGDIPFRTGVTMRVEESGLTGVAPVNIKLKISLIHNDYNTIDWERFKRIDVKDILTNTSYTHGIDELRGPLLKYNKISGTIPDDVLADPLMVLYIANVLYPQEEGYGFDNLPSVAEIFAMKQKYMEEHPETARALGKLYPLSETGLQTPNFE